MLNVYDLLPSPFHDLPLGFRKVPVCRRIVSQKSVYLIFGVDL